MSSSPARPESIENNSNTTLRKGLTFFVATCIIATAGYVLAGWNWIDAIYMVVITIFGVGYGEVNPVEGAWLKLFTIAVIFAGCSSLIYVIGGIVQMLTEGEIERMLGTRNRTKELDQISDHTIICGYGRVGQMLAQELSNENEPLVILDHNPAVVSMALEDGFLAFEGDAIEDDILHKVGLFRARALATVLGDDAANVFITLTARDLCDSIRIIARAESPCTERKLIRSGATSVVMPAAISAVRIAQLAASPVDDEKLPEDRYRMLHTDSCKSASGSPTGELEQSVEAEIEELAELASDLTRSLAERHQDQITSGG